MLRRLWPYLRPDWWAFTFALLLTPAAAGLSLIQPWLLKRAIDEHVVPGVAEGLITIALLYLTAVVAAYLLEGGYVLSLAWGGQRSIVRSADEPIFILLTVMRRCLVPAPRLRRGRRPAAPRLPLRMSDSPRRSPPPRLLR